MTTDEPPFSDSDSDSIVSFGTTYPEYPANAGQPLGLPYKHAPTPYTSEDNTFHTIGGNTLNAPFLDCKELKAHLCLLQAFKDLRATVEGSPTVTSKMNAWPELARQLDGPDRWSWFLGVAVDRYASRTSRDTMVVADIQAGFGTGSVPASRSRDRFSACSNWFGMSFLLSMYSWSGTHICSTPCKSLRPTSTRKMLISNI